MAGAIHAVTGAFGYSGREIARLLLSRGERVRTLTGHPDRPDPFGGAVEVRPLRFEHPAELAEALRGVAVLHNTWWIRFEHGAATFERAVEKSLALLRAARAAGVERVVHVSITNPSEASPLPYFRGKARVERALRESGLSHAILRPAVFFGGRDVLVNNVAWLLRRFPLFGIVPGSYGLRPIHVQDLAALAVAQAASREDVTLDAVGPESFGFEELVRLVARAVGSRARLLPVPPWLLLAASRAIGAFVGDVPLTPQEIAGLRAGLLESRAPAAGPTRFSDWLTANARALGTEWASELGRHFL
ncbi:MAG TPA: NAD(P)H-binding protein [Anaeromyxobacteraceae bacterium]|nr:NAD(P)H-binding protein [Anaeromyxobacteraceae bacterium]